MTLVGNKQRLYLATGWLGVLVCCLFSLPVNGDATLLVRMLNQGFHGGVLPLAGLPPIHQPDTAEDEETLLRPSAGCERRRVRKPYGPPFQRAARLRHLVGPLLANPQPPRSGELTRRNGCGAPLRC